MVELVRHHKKLQLLLGRVGMSGSMSASMADAVEDAAAAGRGRGGPFLWTMILRTHEGAPARAGHGGSVFAGGARHADGVVDEHLHSQINAGTMI